jgi:hypothetical protein
MTNKCNHIFVHLVYTFKLNNIELFNEDQSEENVISSYIQCGYYKFLLIRDSIEIELSFTSLHRSLFVYIEVISIYYSNNPDPSNRYWL